MLWNYTLYVSKASALRTARSTPWRAVTLDRDRRVTLVSAYCSPYAVSVQRLIHTHGPGQRARALDSVRCPLLARETDNAPDDTRPTAACTKLTHSLVLEDQQRAHRCLKPTACKQDLWLRNFMSRESLEPETRRRHISPHQKYHYACRLRSTPERPEARCRWTNPQGQKRTLKLTLASSPSCAASDPRTCKDPAAERQGGLDAILS